MVVGMCRVTIVEKWDTINVIVSRCSVSKVVKSSLVVAIMLANMSTLLVLICLSNLRSSSLVLVVSRQVVVCISSKLT